MRASAQCSPGTADRAAHGRRHTAGPSSSWSTPVAAGKRAANGGTAQARAGQAVAVPPDPRHRGPPPLRRGNVPQLGHRPRRRLCGWAHRPGRRPWARKTLPQRRETTHMRVRQHRRPPQGIARPSKSRTPGADCAVSTGDGGTAAHVSRPGALRAGLRPAAPHRGDVRLAREAASWGPQRSQGPPGLALSGWPAGRARG